MAWSYDLLEADDRRLFDRLSVFAGGFSLDAVQAVCDLEPEKALDGLSRLVTQSLVLTSTDDAGDRRYALLETLRAYGRERLRECGEDRRLRTQLSGWVLARAEQTGAALRGPEQAPRLRWAEREHDNIRSALEWAAAADDADTSLRVVAALWWSWIVHDRWTEASEWIERVLMVPGAQQRSAVRGHVLHGAGTTAALRGQYALAQVRIDECFSIARELGDDELLLAGHSSQALLFQQQGESDATQPHVQAMLELGQRLGRPWYQARAAEFVASRALRSGDLSGAASHLD